MRGLKVERRPTKAGRVRTPLVARYRLLSGRVPRGLPARGFTLRKQTLPTAREDVCAFERKRRRGPSVERRGQCPSTELALGWVTEARALALESMADDERIYVRVPLSGALQNWN